MHFAAEIRDKPYNELRDIRQSWSVASAKNFMQGGKQYFSAVCWFALKDTSDRLKGKVPLGGIVQSFGGTAIQQWSSPDALKACAGVHVSGIIASMAIHLCGLYLVLVQAMTVMALEDVTPVFTTLRSIPTLLDPLNSS